MERTEKITNKFFKSNTQKIFLGISFVILAIVIYIGNHLFPMYLDDMCYSILKYGDSFQFPETLNEIFHFVFSTYYLTWGGRVVAHLLIHIALLFDPIIHDLINTAFYLAFVWLLYKMCLVRRKHNVFIFILINVSLVCFLPRFSSDVFWITVSANYLWTTYLIFLFIIRYYFYLEGRVYKDNILDILLVFFLGVIAGWTNENTGGIAVILALGYSFYIKREKKPLPKWAIAGIVGAMIGVLLLLFSPGNHLRAEAEYLESAHYPLILLERLAESLTIGYKAYLLYISLFYLFTLLVFAKFNSQSAKRKRMIYFHSIFFFSMGLLSYFVTILSPSYPFPPRAYFGIIAFMIFGIMILYSNISFKSLFPVTSYSLLIIVMSIYSGIYFYKTYNALSFISDTYHKRVESFGDKETRWRYNDCNR